MTLNIITGDDDSAVIDPGAWPLKPQQFPPTSQPSSAVISPQNYSFSLTSSGLEYARPPVGHISKS
jgi:hypothetical protein